MKLLVYIDIFLYIDMYKYVIWKKKKVSEKAGINVLHIKKRLLQEWEIKYIFFNTSHCRISKEASLIEIPDSNILGKRYWGVNVRNSC